MSARRVSFGDRVKQDQAPAPAGRDAFLPSAEPSRPASPLPVAGNPPSGRDDVTWDAAHKRVTFYCPMDLLEELERHVRTTGRSKTQILTEGLRLALEQDNGRR